MLLSIVWSPMNVCAVLVGTAVYGLNWLYYKDRIRAGALSLRSIRARAFVEMVALCLVVSGSVLTWAYRTPGPRGFEEFSRFMVLLVGIPYAGLLSLAACATSWVVFLVLEKICRKYALA